MDHLGGLVGDRQKDNRLAVEFLSELVPVGNRRDARTTPSGPKLQHDRLPLEGLPGDAGGIGALEKLLEAQRWRRLPGHRRSGPGESRCR